MSLILTSIPSSLSRPTNLNLATSHFQPQIEHAVHLFSFPRFLSTSEIYFSVYFWVQPLQPQMTQDTHFSDLEGLLMDFGDQRDIRPRYHSSNPHNQEWHTKHADEQMHPLMIRTTMTTAFLQFSFSRSTTCGENMFSL